MTSWVGVLVATSGLLTLLYCGADLAVRIRGPVRVPPVILKLAQAGDRNIGKGSAGQIVLAAAVPVFVQGVIAATLVLRWDEIELIDRGLLLGELVAAAGATVWGWRWIRSAAP